LTERGRRQAEAAAQELAAIGFDAIYSSDLARARQTAEALAVKAGLPVKLDARLREIHQGDWQGVVIGDIRAGWPRELEGWESDPWRYYPPNGERIQELQQRLFAAINDIVIRYPHGKVAVFTHKLPIALLKVYYQGYPAADIWSLLPANAGWEVFEIEAADIN
jgi:broad specificity phosphatase PhoE